MNILMFVNKDSRYDPRVQKEVESLYTKGHSLRVLSCIRSQTKESPLLFLIKTLSLWFAWLRITRKPDSDIVHAHDFDTLPIAFLIAKLNDKPIIYDAHESYSNMIRVDAPNCVCSFVRLIEKMLIKSVDHIFVATDDLKLNITPNGQNCTTLMNCACSPEPYEPNGKYHLRLSYIGSLEPGRGILEAIEAVNRNPSWGIFIVGSGSLENEVIRHQSSRIVFLGRVEPEFAQMLVSISDAQMICCDPNNPIHKIGIPTRLFEAMAYGKPSIATYHTKAGDIVEETDSGVLCGYGAGPLALTLDWLSKYPKELTRYGNNAHMAFKNKYSWEREEQKLLKVYESLSNHKYSWEGEIQKLLKVYESLSSNAFITDTTIRNKEL